jgi:alginate O-acetyltransferase complex protein AlgI
MIFSSIEFLVFFLIFLIFIKILPNFQRIVIIFSSLFFYSFWNPIFLPLILYFLGISYILIKKKINLKISIPIILLPLFYFKYSFFIFEIINLNSLANFAYTSELPLAISFVTFTIIALLIDVKTKKYDERINFASLSEFLIYFPQLIAGPILRAKELIPGLNKKIIFTNTNIKFGACLFTIGFIKKIFLADSIASFVDPIFENPDIAEGKDLIKAYLLFPLQIYFDFSGYVDMALGISKILSIDLPLNFNKPYLSKSLTEFWRNWHMTLSRWFKDYIYIPLGGSKNGSNKLFLNLVITMSVAGLWHGASLNFILWGFLNGFFLFLEKKIFYFSNFHNLIKIIITCFVTFSLWVIFRIENFTILLSFYQNLIKSFNTFIYLENIFLFLIVAFAIYIQKFDNYKSIKEVSKKFNLITLLPIIILIILTGLAINIGSSDKFIYFDF